MNPILRMYGKGSVHRNLVKKKELTLLQHHINHMMFRQTKEACQDITLTGKKVAIRPITSKHSSVDEEITLIGGRLKQKLQLSSFDSICIYRIRDEEVVTWEQPAHYVVAYIPVVGRLRSFQKNKKSISVSLRDCLLAETKKDVMQFSCRPDKEVYLLVFTKKTT